MKNVLRAFYCGYKNIVVLSEFQSAPRLAGELLDVSEDRITHLNRRDYLSRELIRYQTADLIVIDVDSIGAEDASYLCFLISCFQSLTPVVYMATDFTSPRQQSYLCSGVINVLSYTGKKYAHSFVG